MIRTLIILSLDTTTRAGSIAVADDERILALVPGDPTRTHAERLPAEIAHALDIATIARSRIDLLAVATGPGAFTGLRIGLAAMQGLAMALNKPVAGVSALDALAAQVTEDVDLIIPWMDAQRGDVFASVIEKQSGKAIEAATTASPAAMIESWLPKFSGRRAMFIGDAVTRDAALITRAEQWTLRLPEPLAPHIAMLGRRAALRGEAGPPHALVPIYVRKPDAELERERRGR